METTKIALFKGKKIRKTLYKNEWWFSILDIIAVLTETPMPKTYWAKMKDRDKEISQPFPFWEQFKLPAEDKKMRETDCANTEGIFRIIQSIPSPKAEPFKRWLAKVGFELIFTMLGERSTTEIHKTENSQGKEKLKQDAKRDGRIAGIAKEQLEKEIGRPVVSKENFLPKNNSIKKLK